MTVFNMPPGGVAFGGVAPETKVSANGWVYVVYCGERPGYKFGTHVYRIWPQNNHVEWVDLPAFTETRAAVHIEPDGMYLSWPTNRERQVQRIKVPGFVTLGYPSNGQTVNNPAPLPQPTTTVDSQARQDIANLRNQITQLSALVTQLRNRVDTLEKRPTSSLTVKQVEDIAWSKSADRMYFELGQPNSGIVGRITQIVRSLIRV